MNYQSLLVNYCPDSIQEVSQMFWDQVTSIWTKEYSSIFLRHGEITLQNFHSFSFLIDHVWLSNVEQEKDFELPETRVIGSFGISTGNLLLKVEQ